MALPYCHSRRTTESHKRHFYCAHPKVHAKDNCVSASLCRICQFHRNPAPDHFRSLDQSGDLTQRPSMQLVVAKYREDVSWLQRFRDLPQIVYDKGDRSAENHLPNVGREAHTYLHHIIENYDDLADVSVFLQGDPHFHCANVDELIWGIDASVEFLDLCDSILVEDGLGRPLQPGLPITKSYAELFDDRAPDYFLCHAAACFAVTRELIHRHPVSFYQKMLDTVLKDNTGPYWAERLWRCVFTPTRLTEGIVTAADANAFRDLQFLIRSIQQQEATYPMVVYDLGLTANQRDWIQEAGIRCMSFPTEDSPIRRVKKMGWWQSWLKPFYLFHAPFDRVLWIDTDCTVLGDLSEAFEVIRQGPLLVRDSTDVRTENDPRLYSFLKVPTDAQVSGISVNAGVVGLCKHRDKCLLNAWGYGVQWIADNPDKQKLVAWVDQGILLWAILTNSIQNQIRDDLRWNQPSFESTDLIKSAVTNGHSVLEEVRLRFPDAGIVHWLGIYKLARQLTDELETLFVDGFANEGRDEATSNEQPIAAAP